MGFVSRATPILQGDTKAAETAHNKAAEAGAVWRRRPRWPITRCGQRDEDGSRSGESCREIHLCVFEQRLWGAAGLIGSSDDLQPEGRPSGATSQESQTEEWRLSFTEKKSHGDTLMFCGHQGAAGVT